MALLFTMVGFCLLEYFAWFRTVGQAGKPGLFFEAIYPVKVVLSLLFFVIRTMLFCQNRFASQDIFACRMEWKHHVYPLGNRDNRPSLASLKIVDCIDKF